MLASSSSEDWKVLTDAIAKSSDGLAAMMKTVSIIVSGECDKMCSEAPACSVLKKSDTESLKSFEFSAVEEELRNNAPFLLTCLKSACAKQPQVHGSQIVPREVHPGVISAAAVLLKTRSERMSAFQYEIGLCLKHGGATSKTITRLSQTRLSVTEKSVSRKLDEISKSFDNTLLSWKREIEGYLFCKATAGEIDFKLTTDYQIIGDNIDLEIRPHLESLQYSRQSLHWFNLMAVKHRIAAADLPDDKPLMPLENLDVMDFIPSFSNHIKLRNEFATLVKRILLKRFAWLQPSRRRHTTYIRHKYSDVTKSRTSIVSHCLNFVIYFTSFIF